MSIETTLFAVKAGPSNVKELNDWMFKNATDYFDEFACDISNTDSPICSFRKGDARISFTTNSTGIGSSSFFEIILKNGMTKNHKTYSISNPVFVSRAIKTNSGIILSISQLSTPTSYTDRLYISKTNKGNTGIIIYDVIGSSSAGYYSYSLNDSTITSDNFISRTSSLTSHSTITSFANVPCYNGSTEYFQNVFLSPFYTSLSGVVADENGTKYVYGSPNASSNAGFWVKD